VRVNIVMGNADMKWIAGRLARELVARLPAYGIEATINGSQADLEYQQIVYGMPNSRPAVGLFTHGEDRARANAQHYDGHIALNPYIANVLKDAGAPNPVVIEQAVDARFRGFRPGTKKAVFGVAGSTKRDGRKGEALVRKMLGAGYIVIGWGSGWPCPIVSSDYARLPDFYASLDYYVVTSQDEGGCTPIIECMAMGIPVISPRIGFAINRPVLEYEAGDWASLERVLRYLTEHQTYDDWARQHADYFKRVLA
jgi:glycosyltransferase involved in cell wall biosynthesis